MWEARRSVRDSRWHPCGRVLALRLPISSSTCCSISISLLRLRLALGFVADGGGHDGDGGNGGGGDGGCGHGGMLAVSEGGGDQSSSASGSSSTGGGGGGGVSRAVGSEQGGVMCGDARALCVRKEEKWFSCDNSLTRAGRPTHSPPWSHNVRHHTRWSPPVAPPGHYRNCCHAADCRPQTAAIVSPVVTADP